MTTLKKILTPIFLATLSACSSGSGDSNSGSSPGTSISEDAFINNLTTGIVRIDTNVDLSSLSFALTPTITANFSGTVTGSQIMSLIINGTNVTSDGCTLEAPVTEPLSSAALDDGDIDLANCSPQYFQVNDTQSRIEYSCSGQIPSFTADFTYIANTPQFDLGELSMNFTSSPDMTTSDGVCGSLASTNTSTTTTPAGAIPDSSEKLFELEIVAPYVNGNKIILDLAFADSVLVAGDYNIVSTLPDTALNVATLTLSSVVFGGNATNPARINAASGTVTILSVAERAYSGSYTVNLENGEALEGTFSLSL